jgi:hypothetical protein
MLLDVLGPYSGMSTLAFCAMATIASCADAFESLGKTELAAIRVASAMSSGRPVACSWATFAPAR